MKSHTIEAAGTPWTLLLMNKAEFAESRDPLPQRGGLLRLLEAPRGCRLQSHSSCLYGVVALPTAQREQYALWMGFYLQADRLYLVEGGAGLADLANRMLQRPQPPAAPEDALLTLLQSLLERIAANLQQLGSELDAVEERLLVQVPKDFYGPMLRYQRRANHLHDLCQQLFDLCEQLEDETGSVTGRDSREAWQRLGARIQRQHDYAEALREQLVQLRELYQAQVSASQNRTMTLLTVVTAIFAPLTLLAGWYGMNFTYMPELQSRFGYIGIIVVSGIIVVVELIWFHRHKML